MYDPFVEKYGDVLQNIEFAIVTLHHEHPDLLDYHVDSALEAAAAQYGAELKGRTPRPVQLDGPRRMVYDAVRNVCEWRLGRAEITVGHDTGAGEPLPPLRVEEIAACLRRIHKSAQGWTKRGGRQGYLQFVSRYIG